MTHKSDPDGAGRDDRSPKTRPVRIESPVQQRSDMPKRSTRNRSDAMGGLPDKASACRSSRQQACRREAMRTLFDLQAADF
jgi:hypothetical protein